MSPNWVPELSALKSATLSQSSARTHAAIASGVLAERTIIAMNQSSDGATESMAD